MNKIPEFLQGDVFCSLCRVISMLSEGGMAYNYLANEILSLTGKAFFAKK